MNKSIIGLMALLTASCFFSCKDEVCHDLNYGDQSLDPISRTYERADSTEAFIYKDVDGIEHRYELSLNVNHDLNNFKRDTCEGEVIMIAYSSEYNLRRYSDETNTAIAYAQIADFLDGEQNFEEDRIVDILKLTVYDDNSPPSFLSRICIMTSDRGGSLDQEAYNASQYIEHDSLVLLNKTFYDVFEQNQGSTKMYYTKKEGVVGLTDVTGRQLVLDRTE